MKPRIAVLVWCFCGSAVYSAGPAQPEDFAFWLEQIPGSTAVLVNASWAIDGVQGFSFSVCHDPAETTVGTCPTVYDLCEDDRSTDCPAVECTSDLANSPCGGPPDFVAVNLYESAVEMGVVLMCMTAITFRATERIELLVVTYTPLAARATLEFCRVDPLTDVPPFPSVVVHDGISYSPARLEGVVLDFGPAYVRGDVNGDGGIDIADPILLAGYLFRGGARPRCRRACDSNADDRVDIADVVMLLGHLFRGYGPLAEPRACGRAAVRAPGLDCEAFEPCR